MEDMMLHVYHAHILILWICQYDSIYPQLLLYHTTLPVLSFFFILFTPSTSHCQYAQPVNDLCTDAITLDCGLGPLSDLGTNSGASGTSTPFCGMNPGTHAVWYSVMGNGGDIQVDTCSTNTNFDTRINVYTGDCAAQATMGCVGNNDDAAGSPPPTRAQESPPSVVR